MVEPLMVIKHLKKYFSIKKNPFSKTVSVKAVDDVNLEIPKESIFAIVGESGSGKTTFGRTILKLTQPTGGEVWMEGNDILTLNKEAFMPYRRKMQIVFQDPYNSLHPRKLVKTVIGEGLKIHFHGITEMEIRDKIRDVLVQVGLREEHMFRYPHEFSGGQRQRIAFARAIVLEPEFIVLDEPTSALDVSVQAMVLKILQEARSRHSLTYLFITHNLSIVDYLANHLAVMYLGRVVETGSKAEIFDHPAHPYTRLLMNSNPIPDPFLSREKQVVRGEIPSPANPPSGCHFHPRCPLAKTECREQEPAYRELSSGHFIRCHFPC
jgi:oligopeptide/dipeptide ABC transporter ATP-binding protein